MARLGSYAVLLVAAVAVASWGSAFVGSTGGSNSTSRRPATTALRVSAEDAVILRMKKEDMSMNLITKATGKSAAYVNKVLGEHKTAMKVLAPVMKRLQQRGMDVQEIAEVVALPEFTVAKALAATKKTKTVKKATKAAAPSAASAGFAPVAEGVETAVQEEVVAEAAA
eukprot:TRINITY_DN11800_c0_g1_i2.p2 TRINITY_DN11800_c0_g1~~TRINITY_DN11800_c0_g1_i2.p2  ORF type:complete len:198 (+),score=64.32 TRINITY_DN11800_c0_g1_i2:89-595(+)